MIEEKQIEEIRDSLLNCKRPIYFFHDDPDGLCSFLLFYRKLGEGKGIVIKTKPRINEMFARNVSEYEADKVFILDIAIVEQEFVDRVKVPVVWIDHHDPLDIKGLKYFNPRLNGENIPPSRICYEVVKQDLWIAMAGCIGDWYMPDIKDEFCDKYPDLLDKSVEKPEEALFNSKLGKLIKILSFNLKGKTQDVMKSAKVLTRIESPYEILEQKTPKGKFIYQRYEKIKKFYDDLLGDALKCKAAGDLFIFTYTHDKFSLTKELSNELLYRFPKKIILIGREKSGEMKCSLRSGGDVIIPPMLVNALKGVEGYGGGHEHACGAVVKVEDFSQFVKNLEKEISAKKP
jgi:single-stranded DNA-specific DHH superfamily exonuclease